jgi:hypothetical protein
MFNVEFNTSSLISISNSEKQFGDCYGRTFGYGYALSPFGELFDSITRKLSKRE